MKRTLFALLSAALLVSQAVSAETLRVVRGSRVLLSDVVPTLPADVPDVELGPAPPPGSSRLLPRREIQAAFEREGVNPGRLALPEVVRVQSAAKRWSPDEIVAESMPALTRALPAGVTVKSAKVSRPAVTSPEASVSGVRIPRLPRKEGAHTTTAIVELSTDQGVVARVPVSLALELSAQAALPDVSKGARVQLVIESGPARVTATAIALSDGEVGETVQFRVAATQKVLYGKLESSELARVVQ